MRPPTLIDEEKEKEVGAKICLVKDPRDEQPLISLIEDQSDAEGVLEELEAAMAAASATPPLTNSEPSALTADAKLKQA